MPASVGRAAKNVLLLLGTLLLAWWFQNDYRLVVESVHTPARILKVTDGAVDYELYDCWPTKRARFGTSCPPNKPGVCAPSPPWRWCTPLTIPAWSSCRFRSGRPSGDSLPPGRSPGGL